MTRLLPLLWLPCCLAACSSAPPAPKADADTQTGRVKLMEKAVAGGYVLKHEDAQRPALPRVWVTGLFHAQTIDEKNALLAPFADYYNAIPKGGRAEPGEVLLLVLDARTGKEVGQFDWRGYRAD